VTNKKEKEQTHNILTIGSRNVQKQAKYNLQKMKELRKIAHE